MQNLHSIKFVLTVFLFFYSAASFGAETVPDFTVIPHSLSALAQNNQNQWTITIMAPAKHHFNLQAPLSAVITPVSTKTEIAFKVGMKKDHEITFNLVSSDVSIHDVATVSAYLCDDAKTYCIKKQVSVAMDSVPVKAASVNPAVTQVAKKILSQTEDAHFKSTQPKKDEHGFWVNAPAEAIAEAVKTKLPLMIDFYGIWCPPCNLLNELVFSRSRFKEMAKKFVLLKLDADQEVSWELKSKFQIAGYPTLVFAKVESKDGKNVLQEIDHISGFLNLPNLVKRMKDAYAHRNQSMEDRVASLKGSSEYLPALLRLIDANLDQHEFEQASSRANAGMKDGVSGLSFKLRKLEAERGKQAENFKKNKKEYIAFLEKGDLPLVLKQIQEHKKEVDPETLLQSVDLITSSLGQLDEEKIESLQTLKVQALDALSELKQRVNDNTFFIDGLETSIGDLDEMKMDLADATHDDALMKEALASAVFSYQQLIAMYHDRDSRGFNLELGYLLRKSGKTDEAKALYARFIKKFPHEFTFYFAAAKFYLELKDLKTAREMADQAVKYAYGDNKIRTVETLAKVMSEQGQTDQAIATITQFLQDFKAPPENLKLRTKRYLDALAELKEKLKAGKHS